MRKIDFSDIAAKYEDYSITQYVRQLILLRIEKVKTSCGYSVPYFQYTGDRDNLREWCQKASITGKIKQYMGFLWKEF